MYSTTTWHNPNVYIAKHRNKWETTTLTTYDTLRMKCVIPQTHVYDVFIYLCKVDYMMVNTFMNMAVILNYNKVMRIIPTSYRVATIVEHS